MKIYDYVIIGTGVAGLNAARLIPKDKKVLMAKSHRDFAINIKYYIAKVKRL